MKQYNKPTVNVVELSVRENIAALPVVSNQRIDLGYGTQNVSLTTYNLAALNQGSNPQA